MAVWSMADEFPVTVRTLVQWRDADREGRYGHVGLRLGAFTREQDGCHCTLGLRLGATPELEVPLRGGSDAELAEHLGRFLRERLPALAASIRLDGLPLLNPVLTERQRDLRARRGTPAEFAQACYQAVPRDISLDEAGAAIDRYQREWDQAGRIEGGTSP